MYMRIFLIALLAICFASHGYTQTKTVQAVRAIAPPKIDGHITDTIWSITPPINNFIINQPEFGKPASQPTEVKITYDDEAIYVIAYLYDNPALIRKQLTARDQHDRQDVDFFSVAFDTYQDKQNAFQFLVTAANVQSDSRISSNGDNGGFDANWDAVWDSKVAYTNNGWIVEMKIPYMSLRFARKEVQDWGVNFSRFIRRNNEASFWNPVDPKVAGFVNQFGAIKGLEKLTPPLRLSFLPYISTGYSMVPTKNGNINTFMRNGGMDVKWGVSESFTVDMTLIPDFGQVVSDNVILNLSPFEQQFNENRPFFTEGTELFNKAGIFYSRRIGRTPAGYYAARRLAADSSYEIIQNPSVTQLYNATKFSGRTKSNLGIGVFNAVTAPMHAEFKTQKGEILKMETEPLTNYNIVVLDQALKNRSSISFTNTNVVRSGTARDANVSALDVSLFDKSNTYNFKWSGRYSHVTGKDPHDGFKSYIEYAKVSGKWQWGIWNNTESKHYDPNDLGILMSPNEFTSGAYGSFNQFTPNKHFNYRFYNIGIRYERLFAPNVFTNIQYNTNFLHVFKNFWDVNLVVEGSPVWSNDYFDLRTPGRKLKKTPWIYYGLSGSTDSRKKLFISWGAGMAEGPIRNDPFYLVQLGGRYRFGPKFSLAWNGRRENDNGNFGFSHFDNGQPIIGRRKIINFNNVISGEYNFKARMNLTFRARHYWSNVNYVSFHDVKEDGWWTDRPFSPGRDQNYNAFNADVFFTWDFRLGSRLIVAWKNALGPDAFINQNSHSKYIDNFSNTFEVPHSNEVSIKFVYFVDYNSIRPHKKT